LLVLNGKTDVCYLFPSFEFNLSWILGLPFLPFELGLLLGVVVESSSGLICLCFPGRFLCLSFALALSLFCRGRDFQLPSLACSQFFRQGAHPSLPGVYSFVVMDSALPQVFYTQEHCIAPTRSLFS
jgi:hypothetical protein